MPRISPKRERERERESLKTKQNRIEKNMFAAWALVAETPSAKAKLAVQGQRCSRIPTLHRAYNSQQPRKQALQTMHGRPASAAVGRPRPNAQSWNARYPGSQNPDSAARPPTHWKQMTCPCRPQTFSRQTAFPQIFRTRHALTAPAEEATQKWAKGVGAPSAHAFQTFWKSRLGP